MDIINELITENQRVPCLCENDLPGVGYLSGDVNRRDLAKNARVELPMWIAEWLTISGTSSSGSQQFVNIQDPQIFGPKVMNALKSDPASVDLRALSPVWLSLAHKWIDLFNEDEFADVVEYTIQERAALLSDIAQSSSRSIQQHHDFVEKLDSTEQELLKTAQKSARDMRLWLYQK